MTHVRELARRMVGRFTPAIRCKFCDGVRRKGVRFISGRGAYVCETCVRRMGTLLAVDGQRSSR